MITKPRRLKMTDEHQAKLRLVGFVLSFVCLALTGSNAHATAAEEFDARPTSEWRATKMDVDLMILRNSRSRSNEKVTARAIALRSQNEAFQDRLVDHAADLTRARGTYFRAMGLGNYHVLAIEKRAAKSSKFKSYLEIHSRFLDLSGREVQMFERQYVFKRKMWVVTYLIDAPALNDRERARRALDLIEPVWKSDRSPASTTDIANSAPTLAPGSAGEASDVKPPTPVKPLDMRETSAQNLCENVPVERRRNNDEVTFLSAVRTSLTTTGSCLWEIPKYLYGLVEGTAEMIYNAGKYAFNSEYRDQVNASVGAVAAEVWEDPKAYVERLSSEVWSQVVTAAGELQCLKTSEQILILCSIAPNLIPGGILWKLAVKAPLTAAELVQLGSIARKTAGLDKAGAAKVAAKPIENAKSVSTTADGSRVHDFDSGISVKVLSDEAAKAEAAGQATKNALTVARIANVASKESRIEAWRKPLSAEQAARLEKNLAANPELRAAYDRLVSDVSGFSKTNSSIFPERVQERLMTNINRAISDLREGETLNVGLYEKLVQKAASAKPGSLEAKQATAELRAQAEILRNVNGQSGATFNERIDNFLRDVTVTTERITPQEAKTFKSCLYKGKSVVSNEKANRLLACW